MSLSTERARSSFNVRELTHILDGGKENTERFEYLQSLIKSDPVFTKKRSGDRRELLRAVMQKLHHLKQLEEKHGLDHNFDLLFLKEVTDCGGIFLHDSVFVPTLMGMTNEEQHAAWVPKALSYEWIGCYAQTEIGHGSNVRGLETTATFIPENDQIEIHSPTPGSTKFWPGNLGILSTHAVVYARLIVKGVDLGIHNFLVQLRSTDDHAPLPGVDVGDIGPKWGTNSNDNGYIRFDRVRIPRFNMLMKHAKLDRNGGYTRPGPAKGAYATMTQVRANLVSMSYYLLSCACTIAVRYSCVRRQEPGGTPERPILDYPSQQYRLLPLVASAYALRFQGVRMARFLVDAQARISGGDQAAAAELHATTCALKSVCTTMATDGIEECRRSCGGHGFLMNSGLPDLYVRSLPFFTAEGDNWLLTQQASRYLLRAAQKGTGAGLAGYLAPSVLPGLLTARLSATTVDALLRADDDLVVAYKHRAAYLVTSTGKRIAAAVASGRSADDAWRDHLVDHYRVSRAHGLLSIVTGFHDRIGELRAAQPAIAAALRRLWQLFTLRWLELDLGEFMLGGFVDRSQAALVPDAIRSLLAALRPDAVALVDAFNRSDYELNSVLGRYDGNYVDHILAEARADPLSQASRKGGAAIDGYTEFLQPLMRGRVARL